MYIIDSEVIYFISCFIMLYSNYLANTTKYTASKRVKSNESKQSQSSQNNETTTKTHDLTQFFERRININDHFRK